MLACCFAGLPLLAQFADSVTESRRMEHHGNERVYYAKELQKQQGPGIKVTNHYIVLHADVKTLGILLLVVMCAL